MSNNIYISGIPCSGNISCTGTVGFPTQFAQAMGAIYQNHYTPMNRIESRRTHIADLVMTLNKSALNLSRITPLIWFFLVGILGFYCGTTIAKSPVFIGAQWLGTTMALMVAVPSGMLTIITGICLVACMYEDVIVYRQHEQTLKTYFRSE